MSQGPSILVVDDSSTMRNLISFHLKNQGYRVSAAASSQEALRQCKVSLPDVVIMDLELNGESGLDLMKKFQRDPSLIVVPIIACSGTSDLLVQQEALKAGAKRYLVKDDSLSHAIAESIQSVLSAPCSAR